MESRNKSEDEPTESVSIEAQLANEQNAALESETIPETWEEEVNKKEDIESNHTTAEAMVHNPEENFNKSEEMDKIYWTHELIKDKNEDTREQEPVEEDNLEKSSELKVQHHPDINLPEDDRRCNHFNETCGFHYTNGCRYAEGIQRTDFEDHPLAKRIYNGFPRMFPFEDNEIAWCVRIEPQDIGMLPMETWILGNNSFLLHGYYSYRHLIFARMNYKNGYFYIIGVPGIYHNREKFMARMFGFENFKCVKNRERKTGEFGYWYIPVLLN
jgi:hypothetical protein